MDRIHINPVFYITVAASILLIPLPIGLAWFTAACIHELCHILALKLCRCRILSIEIGITGAKITTEYLSNRQELICAMAGPLGGFSLVLFAKYLPILSLCGFLQSVFNLLPLTPFDGGRILKCFFVKLLGYKKTERLYPVLQRCLCMILCVFVLTFTLKTQAYFMIIMLLPLLRSKNILAKRHVSQYNKYT